jgi:hypothetical protein
MFVYNSVRRKKHNIHIHIKPDSEANTSIRPKDFMNCTTKFSSDNDFLKYFKSYFNSAVRNNQFCKLADRMKEEQFDIKVKYNGKVDTTSVKSSTHRCVYNVVINKRRTSSYHGYHIYIYFIPLNEIVSCVQNDKNFVVELKTPEVIAVGRVQQTIERRINVEKPISNKTNKPVAPKGTEFVYKIEAENPYYVESLEEAEWIKKKQHYDYKEVLVANVAGVLYELLAPANLVEVDIHDYSKNHIFKTKTAIPKGFKHQKYTVNGSQIVYSNMLIDDAVEGVYDTVGTYAGKLIVVIHRSFIGETREVIYTEDPEEMEEYKSKFMNRQKI